MDAQGTDPFKTRTLRGLYWNLLGQMGQQGVFFVIIVILARLLTPEDFGLIAMIAIVTGLARVLVDFGFGAALVQKQDVCPDDWSSVFWFNVAVGTLVTLAII